MEIENVPRIDLPLPQLLDQLGQIAPHRRGTALQMDMGKEQFLPFDLDGMRDADITHGPALSIAFIDVRFSSTESVIFPDSLGADF